MVEKLTAFDPVKDLTNNEARAVFMADAFETGDANYIIHALEVAVRAKGFADVAATSGIPTEHLRSSFSEADDFPLDRLMILLQAVGAELTVKLPK